MAETSPVEPLLPALSDLVAFLDSLAKPWSLIGGVAVTLRAEARFTKDIDAIVFNESPDYGALFESAKRFGFVPAKVGFLDEASRSRIVKLIHQPTNIVVDIWMGLFPFEARAALGGDEMDVSGVRVRVSTPEDLIVLKAFAGRGIDLVDIETILESCPNLDKKRIERDLRRLARDLEHPEVWSRVEAMEAWKRE